jgi:hypothetical protein
MLTYDFTETRVCIQQQSPTLLESLNLLHLCAQQGHSNLLQNIVRPQNDTIRYKGKTYCIVVTASARELDTQ